MWRLSTLGTTEKIFLKPQEKSWILFWRGDISGIKDFSHKHNEQTISTHHIHQREGVLIGNIFSYGFLEIKCTSEIYDVYFQSAQMTFVGLGKLINILS